MLNALKRAGRAAIVTAPLVWCVAFWGVVLASCSRDDDYYVTAEPPAQYANCTPVAVYVHTEDADNLCASYLGRVTGKKYQGCYVPATNTIILPLKPWPRLVRHEEAHACGWRHA